MSQAPEPLPVTRPPSPIGNGSGSRREGGTRAGVPPSSVRRRRPRRPWGPDAVGRTERRPGADRASLPKHGPTVRHARLERSLPLAEDGRLNRRAVRRELTTEEQVMAQLRLHGVSDPSDVTRASPEPNGMISIIRGEERKPDEPTRPDPGAPSASAPASAGSWWKSACGWPPRPGRRALWRRPRSGVGTPWSPRGEDSRHAIHATRQRRPHRRRRHRGLPRPHVRRLHVGPRQ
ncbi:YetF domain-containing protein [Streptomyces hirsutus]|uniref:YetF domain-containing protein n=1 Tax=Streptomyces hirsutus TaxID=35620 RepID=UPI000D150552